MNRYRVFLVVGAEEYQEVSATGYSINDGWVQFHDSETAVAIFAVREEYVVFIRKLDQPSETPAVTAA